MRVIMKIPIEIAPARLSCKHWVRNFNALVAHFIISMYNEALEHNYLIWVSALNVVDTE